MPPEPHVSVVDDKDDDPHLSDEVEERAGVPDGVIVVRSVPGVANLRQMAIEVLIALGKHYDALARERQGARAWRLAWLWVRAEQIRHAVVFDAQRLARPLWHHLETAAGDAGSRLWLITRSHVDDHGLPVGAGRCTPGDLLAQLPPPARASSPGSPLSGGMAAAPGQLLHLPGPLQRSAQPGTFRRDRRHLPGHLPSGPPAAGSPTRTRDGSGKRHPGFAAS